MERLTHLKSLVSGIYEQHQDPAHDGEHIRRVLSMAHRLGEALGANLDVLLPAALLHDIVNVPKNSPDRARASQMAADHARSFLHEAQYSEAEIQQIATCIVEHSFSRGLKASTLESAILQDADRLDALGAIGILRTAACAAKFQSQFYCPGEVIAQTRELDDKRFAVDHFYVKLYKLVDMMNTEPARREAEKRAQFMRLFVDQLLTEAAPKES